VVGGGRPPLAPHPVFACTKQVNIMFINREIKARVYPAVSINEKIN